MAWHPVKGLVASCSRDALVKLWDPRSNKCLQTLHGHNNTVLQVGGTGRGGGGREAGRAGWWWGAAWGARRGGGGGASPAPRPRGCLLQVHWNANGNWLLTACRDQSLKLFDIRSLRELNSFSGHNSPVLCAAWHPVQVGGPGWAGRVL